jgi:isopenicillin-N epimerase
MIHRRNFIRGLGALGVLPFAKFSENAAAAPGAEAAQNWPGDADPDYWGGIRRQFPMPADEAYFNTGTLGACPRPVLEAVIASMRDTETTIAQYDYRTPNAEYISGYWPRTQLRAKLGGIINAKAGELALLQNATMACNFVAHGLDLKAGDEVLITDQEHTGAESPWYLRAKRDGIVVKQVRIPVPTEDAAAVVKSFADAIGPRTRVIAVAHITSHYGIVLPVKEICALGRERGLFTLVDGAQAVGQLRVDVKAIGCDAYATSPHKWLLAPPGNGLLYVRAESDKKIWPTLASQAWNNDSPNDGSFRLMQFGTGNRALLDGLDAAVDFHQRIGTEKIEKRVVGLADRLRAGLQKIKGVKIYSPVNPALAGAMVTYGLANVDGGRLQDELWNRRKIRVRAQGGDAVRQSTHIYNSPEEIDASLEIVKALA